MTKGSSLRRRRFLRGVLAGGAVTVGLPILDAALNENGYAFAASGKPLPPRFATWFWPLGLGESEWVPKTAGANYELPPQLAALKPFQQKMNLFSGTQVFLDGQPNDTHFTGVQGLMTGKVSKTREYNGSIDALIGEVIGAGTRFQSLQVCCSGEVRSGWSARKDSGRLPAEVSPTVLYTRIFGPEFVDPNAATFTPDPEIMLRRSVLSSVTDERQKLLQEVGAADRAKLDSYFTSLRALEQKLEIQLQKPDPLQACSKPGATKTDEGKIITIAEEAMVRHDLFTQLFVHALTCDQTRVVNLVISDAFCGLRKQGDATSHHTYTHEEPIDPKLGYQTTCAWFQDKYMKGLGDFITALDSVKEGDKTLLDRMLVFAFTDHGAPRLHSVRNYPLITMGNANGRIKTGLHIPRPGEAATRVGFTLQQAMGVPVSSWGVGSNRVTSPISEVLV